MFFKLAWLCESSFHLILRAEMMRSKWPHASWFCCKFLWIWHESTNSKNGKCSGSIYDKTQVFRMILEYKEANYLDKQYTGDGVRHKPTPCFVGSQLGFWDLQNCVKNAWFLWSFLRTSSFFAVIVLVIFGLTLGDDWFKERKPAILAMMLGLKFVSMETTCCIFCCVGGTVSNTQQFFEVCLFAFF